jgi:hypothetical protein
MLRPLKFLAIAILCCSTCAFLYALSAPTDDPIEQESLFNQYLEARNQEFHPEAIMDLDWKLRNHLKLGMSEVAMQSKNELLSLSTRWLLCIDRFYSTELSVREELCLFLGFANGKLPYRIPDEFIEGLIISTMDFTPNHHPMFRLNRLEDSQLKRDFEMEMNGLLFKGEFPSRNDVGRISLLQNNNAAWTTHLDFRAPPLIMGDELSRSECFGVLNLSEDKATVAVIFLTCEAIAIAEIEVASGRVQRVFYFGLRAGRD